ncbi:hypothetical protein IFM47457_01907 [Aspergillus lentulus]|nr:hypothetical protein IFM47457_01907 [Aspergillus lentulus]
MANAQLDHCVFCKVDEASESATPSHSSKPITPAKKKVPHVVLSSPVDKPNQSPGVVTRSRGKLSGFFNPPAFAKGGTPSSKDDDGTPSSSKADKSKAVDLRPHGFFRADEFGVVSFLHQRTPE